jgi:hypothetical protein
MSISPDELASQPPAEPFRFPETTALMNMIMSSTQNQEVNLLRRRIAGLAIRPGIPQAEQDALYGAVDTRRDELSRQPNLASYADVRERDWAERQYKD